MVTYHTARTTIVEGLTGAHEETGTDRTTCFETWLEKALCCCVRRLEVYTDRYHLHVTTLQIAMKTSRGRRLGLEVGVTTAIAVVGDIIDGNLFFDVHDCDEGCSDVKEGRKEGWRRGGDMGEVERRDCSTRQKRGAGRVLCKRSRRESRSLFVAGTRGDRASETGGLPIFLRWP